MPACPPLPKQRPFTLQGLARRGLPPLLALCTAAQAGIVLQGTRVIFPATAPDVTVELGNTGRQPELVQVWLDQGHGAEPPDAANAPLGVSPALFRVDPGQRQLLRIMRLHQPLPTDRESLFWLNILEIPRKADAQDTPGALRFVFSTRIKLMYRPPGLPGSAQDAPARLQWSMRAGEDGRPVLEATNPTPYVVNLGAVDLKTGSTIFEAGAGHVLPGGSAAFPMLGADGRALATGTVIFHSLNDWGASTRHEASLAP